MSNNDTAAGATINPVDNKATRWITHVLTDLGKNGIFIALLAVVVLFAVLTDGILLRELEHDRQMRNYDTLIIDEAHERSLNIDFLLGVLKRVLP